MVEELELQALKKTDIGDYPSDWKIIPIKGITDLMTNGFVGSVKSHYAENDDESVLYIQGYNVEENSFNFNGIKRVTKEFHRSHLKSELKEGDLLTIQTGDIGITTVVPKELAGSNCHALIITRLKKGVADPRFYSYYFNSFNGRNRLKEIETGSTMKHINVGHMIELLIPYPKKEEQNAVATVLYDTDKLIVQLDGLIKKKKAIRQGALQRFLKPKEGWDIKSLGEIGECIIGLTYNPRNIKKEGRLVLRSSNIQQNKLVFDDNVFVDVDVPNKLITRKGDILICVRNGSRSLIGKCAYIEGKGIGETFGAFMSVYRSSFNEFVYYVFQSNYILRQIEETIGATINQITNKDLKSFKIPFPDECERQRISSILQEMDQEIELLEKKLAKYILIKQGLIQVLLTGKVRLI